MKRLLAVVAVIAFLGVLFAKPFDFISHYSQHASHAAHAVSTNPDISAEQHLLTELSDARTEESHIGIGLWLVLISVMGIAAVVGGVVIKREIVRHTRQRGLM
jgi:hypothetical protein